MKNRTYYSGSFVLRTQTILRRERLFASLLLAAGSILLLIPILYMVGGAFGSKQTARLVPPSVIPLEAKQKVIDGEKTFLYKVEIDGAERHLAVVARDGNTWTYADPDDVSKTWKLPALGAESRVLAPAFHPENFGTAFRTIPFLKYVGNTLAMMVIITVGALVSNVLVAYGFSRFRRKWTDRVFGILMATIMIPSQIVLIPSFVLFYNLGWYNTWLPLVVPAFFGNAFNIFLIRQFMMNLPKELDESGCMDGCGPLTILWHLLIPQMKPVLVTVGLQTVIYVWNEFYNAFIYLQDSDKFPVALGIQSFNSLHSQYAYLNSALALMLALPPVLVFFFAQRFFIQGTVISGVKG